MHDLMQDFFEKKSEQEFNLAFAKSKLCEASGDVVEYVREVVQLDCSDVLEYALSRDPCPLHAKDIPQLSDLNDAVIRVCAILRNREVRRNYQATEIGKFLLGNNTARKQNALARYGSDHTVFPNQLGLLVRGLNGYYNSAIGSTISAVMNECGANAWLALISRLILRLPVVESVLKEGIQNGIRARDVVATAVSGRTVVRRMATLRRIFEFLSQNSDDQTRSVIGTIDLSN